MHHVLSIDVKLIVFILSLSIDSFAVAIGLGIGGIGKRDRLRVGLSFALFEGFMPLVGFLLGHALNNALGQVASVLGIIVLFGIGAWIVKEALTEKRSKEPKKIGTTKNLVLTSLSVSLDELAIGFSMGTFHFPILLTVILIAFQSFALTFIGTAFGNRIGKKFAERAEMIAGIVLCGLALIFLIEKLAHTA